MPFLLQPHSYKAVGLHICATGWALELGGASPPQAHHGELPAEPASKKAAVRQNLKGTGGEALSLQSLFVLCEDIAIG